MKAIRPATALSPSDETQLPTDVEAYLDRLVAEQNKFLGAVAAANSVLEISELARYASAHARLNQEFLDAQRALIKRRAARYATARRLDARLAHPSNGSVEAEASSFEQAELARLIDGAFEPVGQDAAVMRRQLRTLLDGWWALETNQGETAARQQWTDALPSVATVVVGDPPTRAALAPPRPDAHPVPVVSVGAASLTGDPVATVTDDVSTHPAPPADIALPDILDDLDTANHDDLSATLASLLDSLGGPMVDLDAPPAASLLVQQGDAPQRAFDGFWGPSGPVSAAPATAFHASQMLVPAVFVIGLVALILALVG